MGLDSMVKKLREELAAEKADRKREHDELLKELRRSRGETEPKLSPRQLMSKGIAEAEAKQKGGGDDDDQDE